MKLTVHCIIIVVSSIVLEYKRLTFCRSSILVYLDIISTCIKGVLTLEDKLSAIADALPTLNRRKRRHT